jgi:RNA polymerase sigma-70 factor (ECF subfamily)
VDRDAEAAAQPSSNASAEAELNRARLRRSVLEALARLPETQAAALVLCHYEGLSLAEAAVVLEASESAIKSLLFRARQSMVAMLAPEVGEEGASHAVR